VRAERLTALVTGATGAIGPSLTAALVRDGFRVRALVRRPERSTLLPSGIDVVVGDVCDDQALERAVTDADLVFHLAAKLHLDTTHADAATRAEYKRVNELATQKLAALSATHGVRRFVYFSTIAVYGPSEPGEIFNEASPLRGDSLYAETKIRGEQAALEAPGAVILRLAAVYGPRIKGNYLKLARAIQRGRFLRVGAGTNRRTLVHEQDVVRAALLAARHAASRAVYNVTDGQIHAVRDILVAMSSSAGRSLRSAYVPVWPVRLAAGLAENLGRLAGRPSPISRAMVDKLLEDVAVSGQRFQSDLGFIPAFDLAAGWRDAMANRC
jgi:UDP-glucose 4-epimerase